MAKTNFPKKLREDAKWRETFVIAWQTAPNMTEVLKTTGIETPAQASQLASILRKLKVPLRNMPAVRAATAAIDIASLTKVAEQAASKRKKAA